MVDFTDVWRSKAVEMITSLDEPIYFNKDGDAVTLVHIVSAPSDDYCVLLIDLSFLNGKLFERDIEVLQAKCLLGFYGWDWTGLWIYMTVDVSDYKESTKNRQSDDDQVHKAGFIVSYRCADCRELLRRK